MTVDPEIQGDVPCSEYACPTSVKKQEAVSAYHSFMRAALGEHDPDRITIKIDPVIVVPKESALKNERTKETPTVAAPP